MADLLVLTETEVRELLDLDELALALENALSALSAGQASVPPRIGARSERGLLATMPGYVSGLGLGAKLVSVFPQNHGTDLPSHQALVMIFDQDTGAPAALIDGTYITAIRTAMSAAVAARAVARRHDVVAILGAGVQGHSHVTAFTHLFDPSEIRVASRNAAHAAAVADRLPSARAVATFEEAVRGADIVCCCTDAADPILADAWLDEHAHVSSVGSGHELDATTVARGEVFVESRIAVEPFPAGSRELEGREPSSITEIGQVFRGEVSPRRVGITVYKSMGHAVEDLAAASVVLRRAHEAGRGTTITV